MAATRANSSGSSNTRQTDGQITAPVSAEDFKQWLHAMKLVARMPGGMPPEFRKKLWLALADQYLQSASADWPRDEQRCLSDAADTDDDEELGIQIVKDLHRTGSSLCSGPAGSINQVKLKRVLIGYARWNPEVGYCQGFNMLGALMLQVMDKEAAESFRVMICLVEGRLPPGYFNGSLGGLQVDMAVFRDLLAARLPKLSRHLQRLQAPADGGGPVSNNEPPLINVFTMQWFLTLFCTCLPINCVLRVWDLVLIEGSDVLLRTALAIWGLLEERILTAKTADDFYCKMGMLSGELLNGHLFDSNGLIQKVVDLGPIADLQKMRDKHLYNVTPWKDKRGLRFFFSDDDADSDTDTDGAWSLRLGGGRRASFGLPGTGSNQTTSAAGALDIGLLKRQYDKLRDRQRQAQIILTQTARQTVSESPAASAVLAAPVNQYLLGRNAIVSSKGRRLGPPAGAVPPARKQQPATAGQKSAAPSSTAQSSSAAKSMRVETLLWKDINATRRASSDAGCSATAHADHSVDEAGVHPLNKSPSVASTGSSLSERSASAASVASHPRSTPSLRQRSESSSYSDDSDAGGAVSSTSTSLCDDTGAGTGGTGFSSRHSLPSSVESSPMRRPHSAAAALQTDNQQAAAAELGGTAAIVKQLSAEDTEVMAMLRTAKLDECISELNKQNLCGNCEVLSCGSEGELCSVVGAVTAATCVLENQADEKTKLQRDDLTVDVDEKLDGSSEKNLAKMDKNISLLCGLDGIAGQHSMETIDELPLAEEIAEILNEVVPEVDVFQATVPSIDNENIVGHPTVEPFEKYLQINFPSAADAIEIEENVQSTPSPIVTAPPSTSDHLPFTHDATIPSHIPTSPTTVSKFSPSDDKMLLTSSALSPTASLAATTNAYEPRSTTIPESTPIASQPTPPPLSVTSIGIEPHLPSPTVGTASYRHLMSSSSPPRTPSAVASLDSSGASVAEPTTTAVAASATMNAKPKDERITASASTIITTSASSTFATQPTTAAVEFKVNDEGVCNEYFERVTGAPERPTRLELLSSTSDEGCAAASFVNDDLTRDIYASRFVLDELTATSRAVQFADDVFEHAMVAQSTDSDRGQEFKKEKSFSLDDRQADGSECQPTSCPETSIRPSDRMNRIIEENSRILQSLLRKGSGNVVETSVVEAVERVTPVIEKSIMQDTTEDKSAEIPSECTFKVDEPQPSLSVVNEMEPVEPIKILDERVYDNTLIAIVEPKDWPIASSSPDTSVTSCAPVITSVSDNTPISIVEPEVAIAICLPDTSVMSCAPAITSEMPTPLIASYTTTNPSLNTSTTNLSTTSTTDQTTITDISETLSSIQNTIRSIDSLCLRDHSAQRSRDRTVEVIESMNEWRYRKPPTGPANIETGDDVQPHSLGSYSRSSRMDLRREISPRRQSRADEQRAPEHHSVLRRDRSTLQSGRSTSDLQQASEESSTTNADRADPIEPITSRSSTSRYSFPPGLLDDFIAPATATHSHHSDRRSGSGSRENLYPSDLPSYYAPDRKINIRHTTVTSTFYDRFLSQKQENRRSQLNVRLLGQSGQTGSSTDLVHSTDTRDMTSSGRSNAAAYGGDGGVPTVITQDYLNSLRQPGSRTTSATTITSEVSPPHRRTTIGGISRGSTGLSNYDNLTSDTAFTVVSSSVAAASPSAKRFHLGAELGDYRVGTFQSCDNLSAQPQPTKRHFQIADGDGVPKTIAD